MKLIIDYYKSQYKENDFSSISSLASLSIFFVVVLYYVLLTVRFEHVYVGNGTVRPKEERNVTAHKDMFIKTLTKHSSGEYKQGELVFAGYDSNNNLIQSYYAPFDFLMLEDYQGQLSRRLYSKGEKIFTMVSTEMNLLMVPIPNQWLGKIKDGQKLVIRELVDGSQFISKVDNVTLMKNNGEYKSFATVSLQDNDDFSVGKNFEVNIVTKTLSLIDYFLFSFQQ